MIAAVCRPQNAAKETLESVTGICFVPLLFVFKRSSMGTYNSTVNTLRQVTHALACSVAIPPSGYHHTHSCETEVGLFAFRSCCMSFMRVICCCLSGGDPHHPHHALEYTGKLVLSVRIVCVVFEVPTTPENDRYCLKTTEARLGLLSASSRRKEKDILPAGLSHFLSCSVLW